MEATVADRLMKYYQYVSEEAGLSGKVKLAQMTKIPSTRAAMEPDTQDVIQRFQAAVKEITGKAAPAY
jgi:hypothetical protein